MVVAVMWTRFPNVRLSKDSTYFVASKAGVPVPPPPFVKEIVPFHGPCTGGTAVVLTGINFGKHRGDLVSVTFGTSPCTEIEWISRTTVRCLTPLVNVSGKGLILAL